MELGALTGDDLRLPRARADPRPLRADHRPADEPRVHPSRRRRPGPAAGRASTRSATSSTLHAASGSRSTPTCCTDNADLEGAHSRASATSTSPAAWRWASPARCCAPTGLPWDLRKIAAVLRLRDLRLRRADRDRRPTCYGRFLRPARRDARVAARSSSSASTGCEPGPGHGRRTRRSPGRRSSRSAPTAWATRLDHIRQIMGESMEALIHHFKLVTEGFRVPAGQVYVRGRVAARRARRATSSPTAAPGRTACTSATRRSPTCRRSPAMCEGGLIADVIAAVACIDPVMGGVDR